MSIGNLKDIYAFLRLEEFPPTGKYDIQEKHGGLEINIPQIDYQFYLSKKELDKLNKSEKLIKKKDFGYIESCGYRVKNLYEISISIHHPDYIHFSEEDMGSSEYNDWNANPLRLKLNGNNITIGPVSPLFILLMEASYNHELLGSHFSSLASIKIELNNSNCNFKKEFNKILYYLNSYYLKEIGFSASIFHLNEESEDPFNIYGTDKSLKDIFKRATRKNKVKRKDFIYNEPLLLYNEAQNQSLEQKFLYLYRVLEFFIDKAKEEKLKGLRYKESISEKEIVNLLSSKGEGDNLTFMLKNASTQSEKSSLTNYAQFNDLITNTSFKSLCKHLYQFRNSIVHAKEKQINKTLLPNPFEENPKINNWIYIVDVLARRCIKKYNQE